MKEGYLTKNGWEAIVATCPITDLEYRVGVVGKGVVDAPCSHCGGSHQVNTNRLVYYEGSTSSYCPPHKRGAWFQKR